MKFAMFYEIPVARPWSDHSEQQAYQEVVEQVRLGDRVGFHSVWTVEHHFLEEFSHCSNPEVLYGHLAAVTENLRLGYGVRLMPKPYNHPVRTAESVAVLDLLSNGRVELGTGRSATRSSTTRPPPSRWSTWRRRAPRQGHADHQVDGSPCHRRVHMTGGRGIIEGRHTRRGICNE